MDKMALRNILLLIVFFSVPLNAQFTAFIHADSRSEAMGCTGYALADDESALFYNPAGLGISNQRWNGGASNYAEIPFDFIRTISGYYQLDRMHPIGFASYLNFSNSTEVRYDYNYDDLNYDNALNDTIFDNARVNEFTSALGDGYNLFSNSNVSQSIGITFKYFRYHEEWVNSSDYLRNFFNFDAGYLSMNQRFGYDGFLNSGASINFTRMLKWEKADLRWAREKKQ